MKFKGIGIGVATALIIAAMGTMPVYATNETAITTTESIIETTITSEVIQETPIEMVEEVTEYQPKSPYEEHILNTVTDIKDSKYLEAILWAYEKGITSGTSETTFSPKGTVNAKHMCLMLARAYFPEETKDMDVDHLMTFIGRHMPVPINLVDHKDVVYIRLSAYETVLIHHNLEVFDRELYKDGIAPIYEQEILNEYQVMHDEKINYAPGYEQITREEFIYLLYELNENRDAYEIILPTESMVVNIHTGENQLGLSPYIRMINDIPIEIIDKFNDRGWKVELDMDIISPYCERLGYTNVSGLCSYSNKTLYLLSAYSTYHEFGHFYMDTLGISPLVQEIYNEEHGEGSCLGDYSNTNKSEYFAEAFDYWLVHRNSEEDMKKLQESNPRTYELLYELESNNWKGTIKSIS